MPFGTQMMPMIMIGTAPMGAPFHPFVSATATPAARPAPVFPTPAPPPRTTAIGTGAARPAAFVPAHTAKPSDMYGSFSSRKVGHAAPFPPRDDVIRRAKTGEKVVVCMWRGLNSAWDHTEGVIYIDPKPFGKGGIRRAHYAVLVDGDGTRSKMVVKFFMNDRDARRIDKYEFGFYATLPNVPCHAL
jgi:hypothetical protein